MSETLQQPQQNKGVLRISLIVLLMGLYIAHKVMPVVGYYTPAVIRMGICGLLFVLLLPLFRRKAAWTLFGIFAISGLNLLTRMIRGKEIVLFSYGELQVYLYGLIALRFIIKGDRKSCRNMFGFILVMYFITAVTTILGNGKHDQASRLLATLSEGSSQYATYTKANIGSLTFAYELVLLVPLVIYLTRRKIVKPILGYAALILIGYTLMAMEYSLAVILFFVCLVLFVAPKLTTKRILLILLGALLIFLLFGQWVANVFESLSEAVDSVTLSDRFLSVAQTLRGEETISSQSTQTRMELYKTAIEAFIETSFMGVWDTGTTGSHSFVLRVLGRFGLVGIAGFIVMLLTIHKICLKPFREYDFHPYILWTCLIAVFMMVMNPKSYEFIFLCAIPLFGHGLMTDERRIKSDESSVDRK